MKLLTSHIPGWLKNKFLITATAFLAWMLFFDEKDLIIQSKRRAELEELKESKAYFIQEIARERKTKEEFDTNISAIEKFTREKYLMKRENEDVFIIRKVEKD